MSAAAEAPPAGELAWTAQTPRERIAVYIRKAERATADLGQALDGAEAVEADDGSPFLERWGWSRGEVDQIAVRLRAIAQRLETHGLRGDLAQNLPALGPSDQLGIESVLEGVA